MKLYTYFRSSAAYRVRIALALKGVAHEQAFVHLPRGEHLGADYRKVNAQARVPCLALDDGTVLIQSPAIIEYLDEVYREPPLLPAEPVQRARVRAVAAIIACDIHSLNNVSSLNYLRQRFGRPEAEVSAWIAHWMESGLRAIETLIGEQGWCFGPEPGLADVYLLPQVFSARRFNVALDAYPRIARVEKLAAAHPAFQAAHPSRQPDAE